MRVRNVKVKIALFALFVYCLAFVTVYNRRSQTYSPSYSLNSEHPLKSNTWTNVCCKERERDRLEIIRNKTFQTDPCLIEIAKSMSVQPPHQLKPYSLTNPKNSSVDSIISNKGDTWIDVFILMHKLGLKTTGGTFLECGGSDGETGSVSLHLEMFLNWTGILIEPDPFYFEKLLQKNRRSVAINTCASPEPFSSVQTFQHAPEMFIIKGTGRHYRFSNPGRGRVLGVMPPTGDDGPGWRIIEVTCIPMYTLLLANELTEIDLMVLDVEGSEVGILKSLPFDKIDIKVILIEMQFPDKNPDIMSVLLQNNYTFLGYFNGNLSPQDGIFVRDNVYNETKLSMNYGPEKVFEVLTGHKRNGNTSPEKWKAFLDALQETSEMTNL